MLLKCFILPRTLPSLIPLCPSLAWMQEDSPAAAAGSEGASSKRGPQLLKLEFNQKVAMPSQAELRATFGKYGRIIPSSVLVNKVAKIAQVGGKGGMGVTKIGAQGAEQGRGLVCEYGRASF